MGHFHLHSIIIEIAHLHLLNTEHKERNVWRHFNLREEEKRTGGEEWEESRAMKWYGLSERWLQANQGRRRVLCWPSWSRAGFFGIFWAICTTCLTPPEPEPTEEHDGRPSLIRCGRCLLLFSFFKILKCYIFQGHSLSLHCKRYLGR